MSLPKPSEQAKTAFQKLVPVDSAVSTRPMFGNLAAFVNGNLFCGLFGEDLFVRVSDAEQAKIRQQGGRAFEPMPGRAMTGYVMVPPGWQKKPDASRAVVVIALAWSRALPAKTARAAKKPAPAKAAPARRPR
jgi:TfoX/Sxy family transcriptional regulator of competence genes